MAKATGFIDFTDLDQDPDAWRNEVSRDGKVFIPQGQRCHETHPDLKIGGGTLVGGNCRDHKRHSNVALYVALDSSQRHPDFDPKQPPAHCVYYPIQNMKVPGNPAKFHDLVNLIISTLAQGKKVHVGCIGGHGRTGLVIAAVVAKLGIDHDAIGWTRENYCKNAIETKAQENFVVVHFGAKMPPVDSLPEKYKKRG